MHNNGYPNVGVYGSLNNFISTNLNDKDIKLYPLWVAQYSKKIQYPGTYKGWQYTSDGSVPGINGRVDLSMFN
jgi:GH25 family lysozyme M1 (1,4-beta-N-acetylmuramidase)